MRNNDDPGECNTERVFDKFTSIIVVRGFVTVLLLILPDNNITQEYLEQPNDENANRLRI